MVGAVLLTILGGPKKLVQGVLIGWILSGFFGRFLMGVTSSTWLWMAAAFLLAFFMPTVNGCNQAIWQKKVPPEKQGRVFSARRFIAQVTIPVSMGISGWLADNFFEPGFASIDSWGSQIFGRVFGTGEGAGLSMMIAISGVMVVLAGLSGFFLQDVLKVDTNLPDYDDDEGEATS